MIKNNKYILPQILSGIIIFLAVSCQSHEKKPDDAFDLVKEEKRLNMDSGNIIPVDNRVEPVKKAEIPDVDEWSIFKTETERKIVLNEKKLRELKNLPQADARFFKKISALEEENTDLRRQLNEYAEMVKVNFGKFKIQMMHNIETVNSDLNDLTVSAGK